MTPVAMHEGTAAATRARRALTLDATFAAHLLHFKGIGRKLSALPTTAWIHPPKKESTPFTITPADVQIS